MRPSEAHRDAVSTINSQADPYILFFESAAKEFSLSILGSLINVSAALSVGFPTISELFIEQLTPSEVLIPVSLSVSAILTALISKFLVFWNHKASADAIRFEKQRDIERADQFFEVESFHRNKQTRDQRAATFDLWRAEAESKLNPTFYGAIAVGVLSAICMAASCATFAIAIVG